MKRSSHHVLEPCDEWLSTRNRKKVKLPEKYPKRRILNRVRSSTTSLWQLTQNSQPVSTAATKQSSLLTFFKSSDLSKEQDTADKSNVCLTQNHDELDDKFDFSPDSSTQYKINTTTLHNAGEVTPHKRKVYPVCENERDNEVTVGQFRFCSSRSDFMSQTRNEKNNFHNPREITDESCERPSNKRCYASSDDSKSRKVNKVDGYNNDLNTNSADCENVRFKYKTEKSGFKDDLVSDYLNKFSQHGKKSSQTESLDLYSNMQSTESFHFKHQENVDKRKFTSNLHFTIQDNVDKRKFTRNLHFTVQDNVDKRKFTDEENFDTSRKCTESLRFTDEESNLLTQPCKDDDENTETPEILTESLQFTNNENDLCKVNDENIQTDGHGMLTDSLQFSDCNLKSEIFTMENFKDTKHCDSSEYYLDKSCYLDMEHCINCHEKCGVMVKENDSICSQLVGKFDGQNVSNAQSDMKTSSLDAVGTCSLNFTDVQNMKVKKENSFRSQLVGKLDGQNVSNGQCVEKTSSLDAVDTCSLNFTDVQRVNLKEESSIDPPVCNKCTKFSSTDDSNEISGHICLSVSKSGSPSRETSRLHDLEFTPVFLSQS